MKYTRIFCDTQGESHFGDVAIDLRHIDFAPPAPPLWLSDRQEVDHSFFCTFPTGWFGDWHPTPRRQYYIQLTGRLQVGVSDGNTRLFQAGDIVLVEDTWGKGHTTRVLGDDDVTAAFIQLSG